MAIRSQLKPEGSAASQIVQLMKHHGYNKDMDIELGTVTGSAPTLKVKVDNMSIELESDDLIVSEHLTKHKRRIKITTNNAVITGTNYVRTEQEQGSSSVTDNMQMLNVSGGAFSVSEAEIEYLDELQVGDRIIVASVDQGQSYIILDRAVMY